MTQSDAGYQDNLPPKRAVLVLAAIVGGLAALNVVMEWLEPGPGPEWLVALFLGGWVFEPILFGIWSALGSGSLFTRLPLVVPFLLMLWIAPGLDKASYADQELYEFIILVSAGLAIFTVAMLVCLVVRWFIGSRIQEASASQTFNQSRLQFSTKYLLATTTVWALTLGMAAQLTFRTKPRFFDFGLDFYTYVSFIGGASVSGILLPITAVPLIVLCPRFSKRTVKFAIAFWLMVTVLAAGIITYFEESRVEPLLFLLWESFLGVVSIQLGATVLGLLVALPLRWAGFRLISNRPTDMPTPAMVTAVTP